MSTFVVSDMYCFHMIKQYLFYKITTFPSLLITFEWKSFVEL